MSASSNGANGAPVTDADRQRLEDLIADLIAEAGSATDTVAKMECLRDAALMYERQLHDPTRALVAWQAAFTEAPANDDVAMGLERVTESLGKWDVVLAECDGLREEVEDPAQRVGLLTWLARWQERYGGDPAAAEQRLVEASALAPSSVPVAEALSALHRGRGDWGQAAEVLERTGRACATDAGSESAEDAAGLLLEAARLQQTKVGDAERSAGLYRKVLELNPHHGVAAEALAELARDATDPAAICEHYRTSLAADPDNLGLVRQWADVAFAHGRWDDVRFLFDQLFERVGGEHGTAARPDSRARLNEALDRFVAGKKWVEAIDVLRALAREANGALRAKYYVAAGKIAQHELGDQTLAVELFGLALDEQPEDEATFERVYTMLSESKAWPQARDQLRRMIERQRAAGKADDVKVMLPLWRRLGDVNRTGLGDMPGAAEAYRECARLAPEDRYVKMVADMTSRF
jgi:tetratricopeptide (TPR) repeat protein